MHVKKNCQRHVKLIYNISWGQQNIFFDESEHFASVKEKTALSLQGLALT